MKHYVSALEPALANRACGMFRRFNTIESIAATLDVPADRVHKALLDNLNKRRSKAGGRRGAAWTDAQDAELKRHFKRLKAEHRDGSTLSPAGWKELAKVMPGRSADACRSRAKRIGLKFGWMNFWRT